MSLLGIDAWVLVVLILTVIAGAAVQSLIGLGLGVVAAPVITLADPSLMPVVPLVLALLLPLVTLLSEPRDQIDWRGLAWAVPARVPGTALGVALLVAVSDRTLGVLVAVIVLAAVALTAGTVRIPITPTSLIGAGLASGVSGTATSIGGPPIAVLYQHRPSREIRSTLAVYFVVGALLSLVGLGLGGEVARHEVIVGLCLIPCLVLGTWAGKALRARLPEQQIRPAVLTLCALSALLLLVRSLSG